MIKRILSLVLALCIICSFVACGKDTSIEDTTPSATEAVPEPAESEATEETVEPTFVDVETPEVVIPVVEAGVAPAEIYLADYNINTTYIFELEESDDNGYPRIINNTEYNLLEMTIQIDNGPEERFWYCNKTMYEYRPLIDNVLEDEEASLLTITFTPGYVSNLTTEQHTIALSNWGIGVEIDMDECSYIENDTEANAVVEIDGKIFRLSPGEVMHTSWHFTTKLVELQ